MIILQNYDQNNETLIDLVSALIQKISLDDEKEKDLLHTCKNSTP